MRAKIYQPARNAMQSGMGKPGVWVLDHVPASARSVDPLMGWTTSSDMNAQVRLHFDSQDAALAYAEAKGIDATVVEPKLREPRLRAQGYGENFSWTRRMPWTH